jgi:endonuclease/exonuclease/phosphatase family metal-dependent hydrolase
MQRSDLNNNNIELCLLTYNVWRCNSRDNQARLCEYLVASNADIICLQEVTPRFYSTLLLNFALVGKYDFSLKREFADSTRKSDEDELLMVKKEHNASLTGHVRLPRSKAKRHLTHGMLEIQGLRVAIGTAHLESKFFTPEFTALKLEQLNKINEMMSVEKPDCILFAGDCNFTGDQQLDAENQGLQDLEFQDVWKIKNTEMIEDELDDSYRANDVTWHADNPHVPHPEYHRPDRVLMKLFKPDCVQPVSIARVVSDMSDHYGLVAQFKIGT